MDPVVIGLKLFRALQIVAVLGGIILIHEFGHYLTARWSKMAVDEFAVGIGPTLKSWRRHGTLYKLAPILCMGYVKIRGMEGDPATEDDPSGFYGRPIPQRILVLLGGALFNVITACGLFMLLYGVWGAPAPPLIDHVMPGSPAATAGFESGWQIVSVDGRKARYTSEITDLVIASEGRPMTFELARGEERQTLTVTPRLDPRAGVPRIGIAFASTFTNVVDRAEPGRPAYEAGLRVGDEIIGLNGRLLKDPVDIVFALMTVPEEDERKQPDEVTLAPVEVQVRRAGESLTFAVTPEVRREQRPEETATGETKLASYLTADVGLALGARLERLPAGEAIVEGLRRGYNVLVNVIGQLKILLSGKQLDQVGGPVQIVKILGTAAFMGVYQLLEWAGLLSIMIGVMNLVPLPALDGGRVVFVLAEPATKWLLGRLGVAEPKELHRRVEAWVHTLGLLALLALMVLLSVRDIRHW